MATRPVFLISSTKPFYNTWNAEFCYNAGFAPCQKQKNILAIHDTYLAHFPNSSVLEISSKSLQKEGILLSAFSLKKYVPSLNISVPVENIYQSSKVFENGQQYLELLNVSPKNAKRDSRISNSGSVIHYCFEGKEISANKEYEFYNWIYICALLENPQIAQSLMNYEAFTDIEFCPTRSINCQACAAAIYVSLSKQNMLKNNVLSYKDYCQMVL